MAKKQKTKRLAVRTPDLVDDGVGNLKDPVTWFNYFCLSGLLKYFDIPPTAKEIHVEGSRSPWLADGVRFRVRLSPSVMPSHWVPRQDVEWDRQELYISLNPFIAELGIAEGKTGYIYIRVLYND